MRHAIEEIGMVKVFLSFIEAGEEIFPRQVLLPGSALDAAESSARAALKDAFLKAFQVKNLALDGIDRTRQSIKGIVETAKSLTTLSQQGFKESADLAVGLGSLNADIETVIRTPAKVAEILENSARVVRVSGQPIMGKLALLSRLHERSRRAMAAEAGQAESLQPIIAAQKFFSAMCLLETSKALSDFAVTASKSPKEADPLSENEWRDQLKSLLKRISTLQESAPNIREYETLEILSSKLLSLSESQDALALPNLHRYTSNRRMPFILAVFDMYGSIDRADEVMRRNRLDYPVYIEMGTVLEYLK